MNKIFLFLLICFFLLFKLCRAQEFKTDTSFTTYSAFMKEVKYYPFIKPAYANLSDCVDVKRDLVYATYKGRDMHIDVYSPANNTEQRPVVLFIFGGGWRSGNKSMDAPMAVYFAEHGFIAATVEYRLSTEAHYPAAVYDIKTAIRWLRKNAEELHIDADKIAISGTSAGGQLAALCGATNGTSKFVDPTLYAEYTSDVQAVINIDGILSFVHHEAGEGVDQPGKPSAATLWFGFTKAEKTELWKEASALTHAGSTFPPVLFVNSQHARFHAGRDDLIARLDSLGIYSEVHTLPNTPHTFWLFEPWFETTATRCLEFLQKQFKP